MRHEYYRRAARTVAGHSSRGVGRDDFTSNFAQPLTKLYFKPVETEKGFAIVDIFRLENEKLVEHWDVVQPLPDKAENDQPMF